MHPRALSPLLPFVLACSSPRAAQGTGDASSDAPTGAPNDAGEATTPSDASTGGGGTLCTTLGWCRITDTKLRSVCPASPGGTGGESACLSVVNAWSSAAADLARDVLYLWGGGHDDYHGNEVYALDLASLKMKRLNEPSPASAVTFCEEVYTDGRPSSRHTYDALTYLPDQNQLFQFGGSRARCGYLARDTLRFDLATRAWSRSVSEQSPAARPGTMADYDPATKRVYLHDAEGGALWRYNPAENTYQHLRDDLASDYHMTGAIDLERRLFVMMGGGQIRAISIADGSSYATQNWDAATTGCDALRAANSPGLTYAPELHALVGWAGGSDVYLFDATTRTCTKRTFAGGPGPQQANGTFGRFRYFPHLKVFAVVNDANDDAFTLRITPLAGALAANAE